MVPCIAMLSVKTTLIKFQKRRVNTAKPGQVRKNFMRDKIIQLLRGEVPKLKKR